jgi:hypothetical protein
LPSSPLGWVGEEAFAIRLYTALVAPSFAHRSASRPTTGLRSAIISRILVSGPGAAEYQQVIDGRKGGYDPHARMVDVLRSRARSCPGPEAPAA